MTEFEKILAKLIATAHADGEDETSYDSNETIAVRRVVLDRISALEAQLRERAVEIGEARNLRARCNRDGGQNESYAQAEQAFVLLLIRAESAEQALAAAREENEHLLQCHAPDEVLRLHEQLTAARKKIANQAERIRDLEGATNHAGGTLRSRLLDLCNSWDVASWKNDINTDRHEWTRHVTAKLRAVLAADGEVNP